jgi:hypothetical protein
MRGVRARASALPITTLVAPPLCFRNSMISLVFSAFVTMGVSISLLMNAYIATYMQLLPICPIRADRGHLGGFPQLSFAWLEENVYKRNT